MALYLPNRCPKCFESVTLVQPQYKGGAFKGPAKDRQCYLINELITRLYEHGADADRIGWCTFVD